METDSTAAIGAVCQLKSGDKFLLGATTDTDGSFTLQTDNRDMLTLEIKSAGCSPAEIRVPAGTKDLNVGDVYLSSGLTLGEVEITGSHTVDARGRTIIYPSGSEIRSSMSAVSLLQKMPLPGLDANPMTRTLQVDGGTPMILINGIPSTIEDFNALQPKDISKIEFSRMTPARYADRGTHGLISITLKKRNDGGSIYLWGRSAFTCGFMDGTVKGSYHQGPSEFSVRYNPSWRNYQKVYDRTTESYIAPGFRTDLSSEDRNPFNYLMNPVTVKYNYAPSARTLFSATFTLNSLTSKSRYEGFSADSHLGDYEWASRKKQNSLTPSVDLFLHHDFNDNNSLEVELVGTINNTDMRRTNDFYLSVPTTYTNDIDSRRRSLIAEVSYIHRFAGGTELSMGYQNTISHSKNTYLLSGHKPTLRENNNYVYAQVSHQFGKLYVSASTGMKMFWTRNDLVSRNFIRNRSLVQASYQIDQRWNVQAYFLNAPNIPSLTSLTDYPQQMSPYLVYNGNPKLKVSEIFVYQIQPSLKLKKFTAALNVNYANTKNTPISDLSYMGDGAFLSQTVNAKSDNCFQTSLYLQLSDLNGFGIGVSGKYERYHCAGEGWSNTLNTYEVAGSVWWTHKGWTISYYGRIPGKYLYGHEVGKGENGNSFSVGYKPDKHWDISVSWWNCFDPKGFKYPQWNISAINPSATQRWIKDNGNMISLDVSYTADFGSIFRSARRKLNNKDSGTSLPGY